MTDFKAVEAFDKDWHVLSVSLNLQDRASGWSQKGQDNSCGLREPDGSWDHMKVSGYGCVSVTSQYIFASSKIPVAS